MGLKRAGEILAHQSGVLAATKYIGLHTGNPTAANELTGNGYARLAITSAQWTYASATGQASNTNELDFFDPTGDFGTAISHFALWDALTAGNIVFSTALTSGNVVLQQNANITAAVAAITALISGGDLTALGSQRCLSGGLFGASVDIGLHTGVPTSANEVSGTDYARASVPAANWTVDTATGRVSNSTVVAFPTPGGSWGDVTHIAIYEDGSDNILVADSLDNNPPSILAGATVQFAIGAIFLDLQTDN